MSIECAVLCYCYRRQRGIKPIHSSRRRRWREEGSESVSGLWYLKESIACTYVFVGISAFGGTIQCRLAYHVPSLQHLEILNSTMCESSERNQATAQQQIEKRDRVTESVSGLWYLNESIACMYMCGLVIIFPLL